MDIGGVGLFSGSKSLHGRGRFPGRPGPHGKFCGNLNKSNCPIDKLHLNTPILLHVPTETTLSCIAEYAHACSYFHG